MSDWPLSEFACPQCGLTSTNCPQPCPNCDFVGEPITLPREQRPRLKLIEVVSLHGACAPHRAPAKHAHAYEGQLFLCCGEQRKEHTVCCDLPVSRRKMRFVSIGRMEVALLQPKRTGGE